MNNLFDQFPFEVYLTLPSLIDDNGDPTPNAESYLISLGSELVDMIPFIMKSTPDISEVDVLSTLTFSDYLTIKDLDISISEGQLSLAKVLTHQDNPSVNLSLSAISSYTDQMAKFQQSLPEHAIPTSEVQCSQSIQFHNNYSNQISISMVAAEWHCDWNHVVDSLATDVLITLDYLSAKSSSDWFQWRFTHKN